jgi:hypothetical protein
MQNDNSHVLVEKSKTGAKRQFGFLVELFRCQHN